MEKVDYQIEGMTLAVTKMDEMLDFYSSVFNIDFEENEMYGTKLYSGNWGDMKLLFCPAEIARNTADQNRHQFDVIVSDLKALIGTVKAHGGTLMGEITENDQALSVGVYDPDNNSIVFKELRE